MAIILEILCSVSLASPRPCCVLAWGIFIPCMLSPTAGKDSRATRADWCGFVSVKCVPLHRVHFLAFRLLGLPASFSVHQLYLVWVPPYTVVWKLSVRTNRGWWRNLPFHFYLSNIGALNSSDNVYELSIEFVWFPGCLWQKSKSGFYDVSTKGTSPGNA